MGPAWWDLTLLEGRCGPGRRYPRTYWEDFCAGYGLDPRALDGTATRRLRSLATAVVVLRRGQPQDRDWVRFATAVTDLS